MGEMRTWKMTDFWDNWHNGDDDDIAENIARDLLFTELEELEAEVEAEALI
jgi:hypothetical protein